jgi:hypothetical protein
MHRRGHNVAIIRVRQHDRRDKVLKIFDHRLADVRIHELTRARDSFGIQILPVLQHITGPLIVDHVALSGAVHVR